ncbi:MAG: hypothetical protein ACYC3S_13325 [Chloroflexota bacterium]
MTIHTSAIDRLAKIPLTIARALLRRPLVPVLLVATIMLSGCNAISRATGPANITAGPRIMGSGCIFDWH